MEKYERLGVLGEGSYGVVTKCRHKETSQVVAVKKFIESEDDKIVKKIAQREIRMLKQLRHENLISLLDVYHRKKRLYLVFEFMDRTVLDDMEKHPEGLKSNYVRQVIWQVLKGVEFIHNHEIIHRDVKPENILVSKLGVVKLCDFGFARAVAQPGEKYTDYVATRWYRAPELLVGDPNYGKAVDIWAVGCLFPEMLTGEPLFPGNSDIDQIFLIRKCFGNLPLRFREIFRRNENFIGMRLPEPRELEPIERRLPHLHSHFKDIVKLCLRLEPNDRPSCSDLLKHVCFTHDDFHTKFTIELRDKVIKEMEANPLLKGLGVTIHGSAHEYLQQQAEAQGIDRSRSEKDIGKEDEEEGGKKERVKKGERKKYGPKPKRKVYDAKSTVAMAMQVADVSAASVMHRAKEPTTTFIKPPEVDSRQKKNSYPQPVELSSLSKPMGSLSQTSLLNGRRSGVSTPLGGPHPLYTITAASPTPHQGTPKTSKISISTPVDTMSAPHRVMHNLSGSGGGPYPTSQQGPTHVDSVTSVTTALSGLSGLSGLSSHSTNGTDMSPERAAQSKLRQSASKGYPLIPDPLLGTSPQMSPGQQRAMPSLRKANNQVQLPFLQKESGGDKSKVSPSNTSKPPLIGFITGGSPASMPASGGGGGAGKSLLYGANYLSSGPTAKVQVGGSPEETRKQSQQEANLPLI